MSLRTITLKVDEDDFRDIQREFATRQRQRRILPEGESALGGAMVGEIVRDLWEYRDLCDQKRPSDEPPGLRCSCLMWTYDGSELRCDLTGGHDGDHQNLRVDGSRTVWGDSDRLTYGPEGEKP